LAFFLQRPRINTSSAMKISTIHILALACLVFNTTLSASITDLSTEENQLLDAQSAEIDRNIQTFDTKELDDITQEATEVIPAVIENVMETGNLDEIDELMSDQSEDMTAAIILTAQRLTENKETSVNHILFFAAASKRIADKELIEYAEVYLKDHAKALKDMDGIDDALKSLHGIGNLLKVYNEAKNLKEPGRTDAISKAIERGDALAFLHAVSQTLNKLKRANQKEAFLRDIDQRADITENTEFLEMLFLIKDVCWLLTVESKIGRYLKGIRNSKDEKDKRLLQNLVVNCSREIPKRAATIIANFDLDADQWIKYGYNNSNESNVKEGINKPGQTLAGDLYWMRMLMSGQLTNLQEHCSMAMRRPQVYTSAIVASVYDKSTHKWALDLFGACPPVEALKERIFAAVRHYFPSMDLGPFDLGKKHKLAPHTPPASEFVIEPELGPASARMVPTSDYAPFDVEPALGSTSVGMGPALEAAHMQGPAHRPTSETTLRRQSSGIQDHEE